jgi:hypothetical protein
VLKVIYLAGLGDSGSTLLERMLGGLPSVYLLGQVSQTWRRGIRDDGPCTCGKHFSDCMFWAEVGERAFGGWHNIDVARVLDLHERVGRARRIPALALGRRAADTKAYAGHYESVYQAAARVARADVIVDSSRQLALAYVMRNSPTVDVRVVHVVRNPRALATPGSDPMRTALVWNAHSLAVEGLRGLGVPVRRVRYERLLDLPRATLGAVADFAGVDLSGEGLDFVSDDGLGLGPGHRVRSRPIRPRAGTPPARRDGARVMASRVRRRGLVGVLTAPLALMYGYRPGGMHR